VRAQLAALIAIVTSRTKRLFGRICQLEGRLRSPWFSPCCSIRSRRHRCTHVHPASAIFTAPSAMTNESLTLMCGQRSAASRDSTGDKLATSGAAGVRGNRMDTAPAALDAALDAAPAAVGTSAAGTSAAAPPASVSQTAGTYATVMPTSNLSLNHQVTQ
jgi:hypothetical protein